MLSNSINRLILASTVSCLLLWAGSANAITATWVAGSGPYSSSSNWDIPDVPCIETLPATEDAIIPAGNIVISQDVTNCSVQGLTIGVDATFSLLTGTAYNATTADIAGTISGSGNLTVLNTLFSGPGAYVFGSDVAAISLANVTSSATDHRFAAASGAVVEIQTDALTSIGAPNSTITVLSANGSGSMLLLPSVATLDSSFNSGTATVQSHQIVASDNGVIDLSGLISATGPDDDEDYLYFSVADNASIHLDSLQTVSAEGYVLFDAKAGGTISLPSLQNTLDAFFLADEANSQILANASAWTFSSLARPNSSSVLVRATGNGALADLSGMTELDAGFNSGTGTVQFHQVIAGDNGAIDLSGLNSVTGPSDDEDYLYFSVADSASINLDNLQTASAGGYILFDAVAGGTISLPSLQNTLDVFFLAEEPNSRIMANASAWTFSSLGRPNSNTTLARAAGSGALVDLSGMTELITGFNSGTGTVQFHQVVADDNSSIDLSGISSLTGPIDDEDYLYFSVSDGASINLDNLQTVSADGYVLFDAKADGTISLPSLQNTLDAFFLADEANSQILANASAWTFSSLARPNSSSTLIRAMGIGALADLSGMTELNAGFNSGTGTVQFHQVVASDNGSIDLSGITSAIGPIDDEDYLYFSVSDSASINLDNLQTASAGGYILFDAEGGGTIVLPSLQNTLDVFFVASDPNSQILAHASTWTFSSLGRPNSNSTLIRAAGSGALVDLSGMTILNAGFNSGTGTVQFHQVVASDNGVVDLSGLTSIIGPLDTEDSLRIIADTGGTLVLGSLANVTDGRNVTLTLTAAQAEFPLSLNADDTITVFADTDSTIGITGHFSFDHVDESRFNLEVARVSVQDNALLNIEVGGSNEGTTPASSPNFGIGQLIVGSAGQTTTARLVDVVDNGNGDTCGITGAEREVLYLNGFDIGVDPDGLRILNGSTLVLGGLELYASVGGVLTHINPWLTPGVPLAFDDGFIELGVPFDFDMDGVADGVDNCVLEPNPAQADTDGDGYGNACDADLNGDLFVNNLDLAALRATFFSTPASPGWNPDADFNNDNIVNFLDLAIIRALFFAPPGPACPVPQPITSQSAHISMQENPDRLIDAFGSSLSNWQ